MDSYTSQVLFSVCRLTPNTNPISTLAHIRRIVLGRCEQSGMAGVSGHMLM